MADEFGVGGAIAGGLLGLAGNVISSVEQRAAATRFRRRQRSAIESARSFADERVSAITGGDIFRKASDFLSRTFDDGTSNPLAGDIAKRLSAMQAERGAFFGGSAALDVAGGAAGFLQQQRQSLLPTALQFAFEPERIRQSVLGFEAPLRIAASTGAAYGGLQPQAPTPGIASSAINGLISGAAGGYNIGSTIGRDSARLDQSAQRDQSYSALAARIGDAEARIAILRGDFVGPPLPGSRFGRG